MKIVLASQSLRRIELLKEIVSDFEVQAALGEEILDLTNGIEEGMKRLAYQKAKEVYKDHRDACVIGSDTLVFLGNNPIGKPRDRSHAKEVLLKLKGKSHYVYTSVAIISKEQEYVFVDATKVSFKNFSDEELEEFLDTNEWEGKSGAYAIQSLDDRYIDTIDGDIYTVIGFPYSRVKEALEFMKII